MTYLNLFGPSENITFNSTDNIPLQMLKWQKDNLKKKKKSNDERQYYDEN